MSPRRIPGPAELAGRGRQWLAAAADRAGLLPWGDARLAAGASLRPALPTPPLTREQAVPHSDVPAVRARADLVLDGRFPLLGFPAASPPRTLDWGTSPDWHTDILAGRTAPRPHGSRVPYLDEAVVGDHKVTWELNRQQWLTWLALAARCTGEARYDAALWRHLSHWLRENPRGQGINWASSLEVAFRSIAWTWALHLAPGEPPAALAAGLATSLHHHGRHVERWLSTWFSPNTHLTGEALALLYLGVAWPQLPRAAHWRALGWRILCEQAPVQIRADGTYFEQTGWYQAYTVDFYLHALWLADHAGLAVPRVVRERTRAAAHALRAMTRRDGRVVRWGDDDGGRLLPLSPVPYGDVRDTLALAAVLLDEPALLDGFTPVPDMVAWLLGADGAARLDAMVTHSSPQAGSLVLPDGGWVALRTPRLEAFMDAGPHSALSGAHAHADALSLEVTVDGRCVLADPGTYRYMGEGRDALRATAAHNALTVGARSSATPAGPFRWARAPRTDIAGVELAGTTPRVQARHDGFTGARTWRELRVLHEDALLVIDWVEGAPDGPLAIHWRPPLGVRAEPAPHGLRLLDGAAAADPSVRAPVLATIVIPADWQAMASTAPYSSGYGVVQDAPGVTCAPRTPGVMACCSLLLAGPDHDDARITPRDAEARSWRVEWRGLDLLVTPTAFR